MSVQQKKQDLVCPFHNDLEDWMSSIDKKLDKLLLWKASVIGYAAGTSAVVITVAKLFKLI